MSTSDARFEYREDEAEKPVRFIEGLCRHSKGPLAGQLFKLEEWQKAILRELYGWFYTGTDKLQYREAYIQLPRKAGKSSLIAMLGLYSLFRDMKTGAEIIVAASTEKQATIVFDIAKAAVLQEGRLSTRVKCGRKWIEAEVNGIPSVYKMVASDPDPLHGLNISLAIIDEVHAHKDREVYDVLKTSQGARTNPMLISITTPGNDKTSFGYEMFEYCQKLKTSELENERMLPVIFELEKEEDWTDPSKYYQCQPNLGVTVQLDDLKAALKRAKEIPSEENSFKQLYLNMWVDQVTRWLPAEALAVCEVDKLPEDLLRNAPCYMGMDLASTEDLTAIALVWPNIGGKTYVKTWSFVPQEQLLAKQKKSGVPYDTWHKQGFIATTAGNIIDYSYIRKFVCDLWSKYNVKELAADPFNATQLICELQDNDGLLVVDTRQGTHVQHPGIQHLERVILNKEFQFKKNPVLSWQFSNISLYQDGMGRTRLEKDQAKRKIDAWAALVNAFTRVVVNVKDEPQDPYASYGLIID